MFFHDQNLFTLLLIHLMSCGYMYSTYMQNVACGLYSWTITILETLSIRTSLQAYKIGKPEWPTRGDIRRLEWTISNSLNECSTLLTISNSVQGNSAHCKQFQIMFEQITYTVKDYKFFSNKYRALSAKPNSVRTNRIHCKQFYIMFERILYTVNNFTFVFESTSNIISICLL